MIDYALFVPACFALNLAFGPNNLLALNHGAQKGVTFAIGASLARVAVFIPMIMASALGLGLLLSASALAFTVLKIVGAAYLIWIGIKLLKSNPKIAEEKSSAQALSLAQAARREATVALSNPKAILVFAAFFPQFVDTSQYWQSYAVLGSVFLSLELVATALYALLGRGAARFAAGKLHWFQRVSGGGMIFFGLALLLARAPARSVA